MGFSYKLKIIFLSFFFSGVFFLNFFLVGKNHFLLVV